MNYTESFQEFSSKLGPTDLVLYAGLGIVIWVLFKDQLSPVQKMITDLLNKRSPKTVTSDLLVTDKSVKTKDTVDQDVFFDLVVSWKQTRDLAVKSGCADAVKVADQMFPFLSPNVCAKKEDKTVWKTII